jgi:PAS domain S-box-containing protein
VDRTPRSGLETSELLLEAMPDAIVIVDASGRVVRANRRAEALSGYSREELLGLPVEQLVPESLRAAHVDLRTSYRDSPAVRVMGAHQDIRFRRRDGSEFPADIALSPLTGEAGMLVVASIRDLTERKLAERELLRAQEGFRLVVDAVRDYAIFMLDPEGRVVTWSPAAARLKGWQAAEIVGRHFSLFYTPEDLAAGKPARELAVATETGRYEEDGWRVRKDGSRFWANVVVSAIQDQDGRLLGFGKITRDVTERKRQDDRLRAVVEVAQAALEGRREEDLLRLVARRARELVEAGLSVISLVQPGEETMTVAIADGPLATEVTEGRRVPVAGSLAERVLGDRASQTIDDVRAAAPDQEELVAAGGLGSALVVLLASGARAVGTLTVANEPGGGRFTAGDRERLDLFAAQAAVALAYARLRDDLQRLAVLDDRERIARELHDGAIQALFAVGMSLQAMAMMTPDLALRGRLESTVVRVDEVIRDLRNYIFGLRPGLAADRHLAQALRELAEQLEQQRGVTCAVEIDEELASRLAGRAADIVQITREALSNVGRHAGAATCRLALYVDADGSAVLEVEDDGHGFAPGAIAAAGGGGQGLRNLRERATRMGGALDVESVLGEGTTVRLRLSG